MSKSKKPKVNAAKPAQPSPAPAAVKVKPDNELKAPQEKPTGRAKNSGKPIENQPSKKKAKPAAQAQAKSEPAKAKPKKAKLVRDSFTMPDNEYQVIGDIKKACIGAGFSIKKSEILRIGVALLQKMPPAQIQQSLASLPALKAGRPKKEEATTSSA